MHKTRKKFLTHLPAAPLKFKRPCPKLGKKFLTHFPTAPLKFKRPCPKLGNKKKQKNNDLPNQHGKSLQSQGRVSIDRGEGAALPSTTP